MNLGSVRPQGSDTGMRARGLATLSLALCAPLGHMQQGATHQAVAVLVDLVEALTQLSNVLFAQLDQQHIQGRDSKAYGRGLSRLSEGEVQQEGSGADEARRGV